MKKKTLLIALCLLATVGMIKADDITEISPENKAIGYKGIEGYYINRTQFSTHSAVAGNIVRIEGTKTGANHKFFVGEWAHNDSVATVHLPGSDYRNLPNEPSSFTFDMYLTEDMLQKIITNEKDFRIYGEGITISSVKLVKPGKAGALKFGKTIWTGYFWMDDVDKWSLELFKETFKNAGDVSKYRTMRIYYEANSTNFKMRLFTKFGANPDEYADGDDLKIAGSYADEYPGGAARTVPMELITLHDNYVDIPLTEAIKTNLSTIDDVTYGHSLFIKCNLNGVAAFNVTDIVLLPISPEECSNCFYVY